MASENEKTKQTVIHSAELEAEMEDRFDDAILNGMIEGTRRRKEREAAEAAEASKSSNK